MSDIDTAAEPEVKLDILYEDAVLREHESSLSHEDDSSVEEEHITIEIASEAADASEAAEPSQPVSEPTAEEAVVVEEPKPEEPSQQVSEPVVEESSQPVSEPVVEEPKPEESSQPVVEEPVVEEPNPEESSQPVSESVVEEAIVVEESSQPVSELVVEEAVAEESSQPVSESVVEEAIVVEEPSQPVSEPTPEEDVTPRLAFIVPYKNREQHHKVFSAGMSAYFESIQIPHKIFYIHQTDSRGFNRGAMKNIGFLMVKEAYPTEYKTMTLVFNDIDTMPTSTTIIPYETSAGTIKHFYGFENTLGGIVSITGADFEALNGFPNFWAWGYEDNLLQIRAELRGIKIDRSVFYKIGNPAIVRLQETSIREVNRAEYDRYVRRTLEGISSICDLKYTVNNQTGFVDVLNFNTNAEEQLSQRKEYDLRNGPVPFKDILPNRRTPRMKMHF